MGTKTRKKPLRRKRPLRRVSGTRKATTRRPGAWFVFNHSRARSIPTSSGVMHLSGQQGVVVDNAKLAKELGGFERITVTKMTAEEAAQAITAR